MKLAAIDIGTNSTRLLIVESFQSADGKIMFDPLVREMYITRLGKNCSR